ncbi:hypothetical protein B0H13DRAFT_2355287 [Mycena leptocephala]|nr:hypothetical protein B0H13DRAFT_2355287 [Mycena leptocephala]
MLNTIEELTLSESPTHIPNGNHSCNMYYEDFNNRYASLSPVPSQTADVFGWDSDATSAPRDHHDDTPTPQPARAPSPASVVEILRDEFPPSPSSHPRYCDQGPHQGQQG